MIYLTYMRYIFIDESGDLGFKGSSSRWFVFTMAVVAHKRSLEHVTEKIWRSLSEKDKKCGELHAHRATDSVRRKVLRLLGSVEDLQVISVVVSKDHISYEARNNGDVLYARIAQMLVATFISMKVCTLDEPVKIVIDRKHTKENVRTIFMNHMSIPFTIAEFRNVMITLEVSHKDKSLQAVDFIAWAIFRKYEASDTTSYRLIEHKVITEESLTIH